MRERVRLASGGEPFRFLTKYMDPQLSKDYLPSNSSTEYASRSFIGQTGQKVICDTPLPASLPVIEHVLAVCKYQDVFTAGGSYNEGIMGTVDEIMNYWNHGLTHRTQVKTITFGVSNHFNFKCFQKSIQDGLNAFRSNEVWYPINHYTFHVEYISGTWNGTDSSWPARIVLGIWSYRWEIIFPWKFSQTDTGDSLVLDLSENIPSFWLEFFRSPPGFAVGLHLREDLRALNQFFSSLRFTEKFKPVTLRSIDFASLMALCGYNAPLNYTALAWIFTGAKFADIPSMGPCLGMHHQEKPPSFLCYYIQNKVTVIMNASTLAMIVFSMNLFPTPGIASLLSRKSLRKFFEWQQKFLEEFLFDTTLDHSVFLNPDYDEPEERILQIHSYGKVTRDDMCKIFPTWSNICFSGCPTDAVAIEHIMTNLLPILKASGMPIALKWNVSPKLLLDIFGAPQRTSSDSDLIGCQVDDSVPRIPRLLGLHSTIRVIKACKEFRDSEPEESKFKDFSLTQLMVLYVWIHLEDCYWMYGATLSFPFKKVERVDNRFFDSKDLSIVGPVLSLLQDSASYKMTNFLTRHVQKKHEISVVKKLEQMEEKAKKGEVSSNFYKKLQKVQKKVDTLADKSVKEKPSEDERQPEPSADQSEPSADQSEPSANQPRPSANQTRSSANQPRSSANQSLDANEPTNGLILYTPEMSFDQLMKSAF